MDVRIDQPVMGDEGYPSIQLAEQVVRAVPREDRVGDYRDDEWNRENGQDDEKPDIQMSLSRYDARRLWRRLGCGVDREWRSAVGMDGSHLVDAPAIDERAMR